MGSITIHAAPDAAALDPAADLPCGFWFHVGCWFPAWAISICVNALFVVVFRRPVHPPLRTDPTYPEVQRSRTGGDPAPTPCGHRPCSTVDTVPFRADRRPG